MYAIIRRYRDHGVYEIARVYSGFTSRQQAEAWNEEHFPSPEYNLIVPSSEYYE
jgi:hypothetical protein